MDGVSSGGGRGADFSAEKPVRLVQKLD